MCAEDLLGLPFAGDAQPQGSCAVLDLHLEVEEGAADPLQGDELGSSQDGGRVGGMAEHVAVLEFQDLLDIGA